MKITKCDICKKTIEDKSNSLFIGVGGFLAESFELCYDCGKPVLNLLKTKKLITVENKKYGRK